MIELANGIWHFQSVGKVASSAEVVANRVQLPFEPAASSENFIKVGRNQQCGMYEEDWRRYAALRTLKPHDSGNLPDTFFASLLDWAHRLRLDCPPLRRAWSGHVLSLGVITTYQLQCSPLVACHLHQAGYHRTDLRPPRRWERCDDRETGSGRTREVVRVSETEGHEGGWRTVEAGGETISECFSASLRAEQSWPWSKFFS